MDLVSSGLDLNIKNAATKYSICIEWRLILLKFCLL